MKLRYPYLLAVLFSHFTVADDVSVPNTFTADTTISSSQMNANFDALVQESNENDARIGALSTTVNGTAYTWLGYTVNSIAYDPPTTRISAITLSNFCKSEFSDTAALVATTDTFFAANSGQTIPLPTTSAYLLPEIVAVTAVMSGSSSNSSTRAMTRIGHTVSSEFCAISIAGRIECSVSESGVNGVVACVKVND